MVLFMHNGKPPKFKSIKFKGFTFIELMVVLVIIALLTSIALPNYFNGLKKSKEAILREDLRVMRKAIDHYYADKNQYPASLQALVDEQYLKFIPPDPITERTDTWQTTQSLDSRNQITNIHTSSSEIASDGTLYNAW